MRGRRVRGIEMTMSCHLRVLAYPCPDDGRCCLRRLSIVAVAFGFGSSFYMAVFSVHCDCLAANVVSDMAYWRPYAIAPTAIAPLVI